MLLLFGQRDENLDQKPVEKCDGPGFGVRLFPLQNAVRHAAESGVDRRRGIPDGALVAPQLAGQLRPIRPGQGNP